MTPQNSSTRGFTLLELSVVLAIIAVVSASGIAFLGASMQSSQVNNTVTRMNTIDQAILNFGISFNRVPCPSLLSIAAGATNYGVEAGGGMSCGTTTGGVGSGACTGTLPVAVGTCSIGTTIVPAIPSASVWSNGAVEGGVPTRSLKLPDRYMYDAWGHRFRYAVDPTYTATNTLPVAAGTCSGASVSALTIEDSSDSLTTPRSSAGLYVLLSHGQNGHGAYTSTGGSTMYNAGVTNTDELKNCHCTAGTTGAVTASGNNPVYVQKSPTLTTAGAILTGYDDIMSYKEPWQIQAGNVPLAAAAPCLWVVDQGNSRVEEFNSVGSFMMSIGGTSSSCSNCACTGASCPVNNGTGNGQLNYPSSVTLDKYGNLWVADSNNNRIEEFSSSGSFLASLGGTAAACDPTSSPPNPPCLCTSGTCPTTCGAGLGQICNPNSVAFDSSNNIWVTNAYNSRVDEYSYSGTYLGTFGTSGTGNGQFGFPMGIGISALGNIWVSNSGSNTVQGTSIEEFTHAGSYMGSYGVLGSSNGNFNSPWGVCFLSIDSGGDIWVADCGNNRIQEFASNGSWQRSIGGPSPFTCESQPNGSAPSCPSGTANGQFTYPIGVANDASGNVWVADTFNFRVQKFNNSGTYLLQFGAPGTASGQFNGSYGPIGIAATR